MNSEMLLLVMSAMTLTNLIAGIFNLVVIIAAVQRTRKDRNLAMHWARSSARHADSAAQSAKSVAEISDNLSGNIEF